MDEQAKRKAQNRAAQRAFRERKENQVRHLEDKVKELEALSNSGKNGNLALENEKLKDMISQLQNENAALLGSAVSFDYPLNYEDDMRPQKIKRQNTNIEASPTYTHLESLSSGYSVSSKSRSNTPETTTHQLTVDDILGNTGLPSDTLLDHSELFGKADYNSSQLQDILQQQNLQFETDPSRFDFFYPLENVVSPDPSSTLNTIQPSTVQASTVEASSSDNNNAELGDVTKVWDKLSEHPRFGEIDIDDLCDKMKEKAVCTDNFDHDKEFEKYVDENFPLDN